MAALMCLGATAFGQDGLLADAGTATRPGRSVGAKDTVALPTTPITDDGREGDALAPVRQLVIAFAKPDDKAFSVDILNERGRPVRSFALVGSGKAVPVSVEGLAEGRYVARITREDRVVTVRFRR